MDVTAYLERIDYHGPLKPTLETLRGLHRAHVLRAPFENLDIHLGRCIILSDMRLIVSTRGNREERALADEQEYAAVLKERFGIVL